MLLVFLFLVLILSILFTIKSINLKNLAKNHDQTSVNLINVFDDWPTTLLSIFLFLIHLFICLNVSVYLLMVYKWSKVGAWFLSWLNINEIQPSKYIIKNGSPIFLDSASFLSFLCLAMYERRFIKFIACIWFTLFSIIMEF